MIDPKELRINNYIKDSGGKMWQIYSWESHNKVASKIFFYDHPEIGKIPVHPYTEYVNELQPIELTHDILIDLGFVAIPSSEHLVYTYAAVSIKDNEGVVVKNRIQLRIELSDFNCYVENGFGLYGVRIEKPVKYLHQLQNLFFGLTGDELIFNSCLEVDK